jgi:hypothetical protein
MQPLANNPNYAIYNMNPLAKEIIAWTGIGRTVFAMEMACILGLAQINTRAVSKTIKDTARAL